MAYENFMYKNATFHLTSKTLISMGLVLAVLGLSSCVTNTAQVSSAQSASDSEVVNTPDSLVEANPDQINIKTDAELAGDPALPKLELDAKTLENLLLVNLASYQGQWALAAQKAQETAFSTKDYRLARLATLLALRDDDYAKGLSGAELWYELEPDEADPLNMLLITQLGSGDVEGAKNSIGLHKEGKELDAHVKQIAALLTRQKNKASALAAAAHMVEEYQDSAQAALSSAFVAEYFSEFEQSELWVRKALVQRPDWELAAQMKAKLLASQDKLDERGAFIADYVKSHPNSVIMQINHAAERLRQGDSDGAYAHIQAVLERKPRDIDVLQYAGALAEDRKDGAAAIRYYQRALNIMPNNDDVRWSLARRYYIEENYKQAERHFDDIRDQNLLFSAQIQVANARYELYGLDSAINTLAGLEPRTEPEYLSLALNRHYLLMSEYQYEEALGAINEVLYFIPDNLDLIYARALVAAELKRIDIAEPDLRTIIAAEPDHANALNALGYTLADQTERYDEARELIEKAVELRPNDAHILDSMGWIAYRQKDYATALEFLEKAYALSEEVEIATHLAEVLWESGEQDRAKEIWLVWVEKDGNNRLLQETMRRYGVAVELGGRNSAVQNGS